VDVAGSGSCLIAGFDFRGAEPSNRRFLLAQCFQFVGWFIDC
jgi:hypothetical protein